MRRILADKAARVLALVVALAAPVLAHAEDEKQSEKPVVDEILAILKQRGDLDEGEYQRLLAKNAQHEEEEQKLLRRITLFGDVRARYEGVWYDRDVLSDYPNRSRGRYRARLGASAVVNDYISAVARIVTTQGDNRSQNQSIGRNRSDFDYDGVYWDWGYIQARSREGQLPGGAIALTQLGKTPNPFVGKLGREKMLWDQDITLEGAVATLMASPWRNVKLYLHSGYSIIDENWSATGGVNKDPHLIAVQGGFELKPLTMLTAGARLSWFGFRSLDASFIERGVDGAIASGAATDAAGNILDGLTGDPDGDSMDVAEFQAALTWSGVDAWPVTVAGGVSQNFSAERSVLFPGTGKEGRAWNAGLELGDKARWVRLGATYYFVEANAFPAMYVDSDTLDGITNRKGWAFSAARQLLANTDAIVTLYSSDILEDALPAGELSIPGADRIRVQADLEVRF